VVEDVDGLMRNQLLQASYSKSDTQLLTREVVQRLQAANIPYAAVGTLESELPARDPVTGAPKVTVKVDGEIWDVRNKLVCTVAIARPAQFSGLGGSAAMARGNAVQMAGDKTADQLVSQLLNGSLPCNAVEPPRQPPRDALYPQKRVALVMGNSTYGGRAAVGDISWPDLQGGPLKDADAVAARLRQLGFEVILAKDQNLEQMSNSLKELERRAPGSFTLFYYSGHGTRAPRVPGEDDEDNYLIPVGTDLAVAEDAHTKAVSLTQVRDVLHHSTRGAVVILDACRNAALPHAPATRGPTTRGLATGGPASRGAVQWGTRGLLAEGFQGMLIAYSTTDGEVAINRPGETSLYTEQLVKELGQPGQLLVTAFQNVRKQLQQHGETHLPEVLDMANDDVLLARQ